MSPSSVTRESYNFHTANQAKSLYPVIAALYRKAFAGPPWFEVSKCADKQQRCPSGFSPLDIGSACLTCDSHIFEPAYEDPTLVSYLERRATKHPSAWYTEYQDQDIVLAASACQATAREHYCDNPTMASWATSQLGETAVSWLGDVFSDRGVRPTGNLKRFGLMCLELMDTLDSTVMAYCTQSEAMLAAGVRDFGSGMTVYPPDTTPNQQYFVVAETLMRLPQKDTIALPPV